MSGKGSYVRCISQFGWLKKRSPKEGLMKRRKGMPEIQTSRKI